MDPHVTNLVQLAEAVARECEDLQLPLDNVSGIKLSQTEEANLLSDLMEQSKDQVHLQFCFYWLPSVYCSDSLPLMKEQALEKEKFIIENTLMFQSCATYSLVKNISVTFEIKRKQNVPIK